MNADSVITIVEVGMEGGGFTVFGHHSSVEPRDGAAWIFWRESGAMYLDDNDDEAWRFEKSGTMSDLALACSPELFRCYPIALHPDFVPWFRRALTLYQECLIGGQHLTEPWAQEFYEPLIDAWSRVIADAEQSQRAINNETHRETKEGMKLSDALQTGELFATEYSALLEACRALPAAQGNYHIKDFVENLLLTVLDFQMNTKAVVKAMQYFASRTKQDAADLAGLKLLIGEYPDDKPGNTALAQRLWGYNLWTRAAMLRHLITFFEESNVKDQPSLEQWALGAQFKKHFEGRVKGLGYAVFNWLVIRQGVESIKPDVHVLRFVEKAIGRPVKETIAVEALIRVAKDLDMAVHKLDWAIWETGRSTVA